MIRFARPTLLLVTLGFALGGCSSSNGAGTGGSGASGGVSGTGGEASATGGAGGTGGAEAGSGGSVGSGGTAGGSGGAGGAGGATSAFKAVNPCNSASDYTTGDTIGYGSFNLVYEPKCLKVAAGASVTFMPLTDADNFTIHPLTPSMLRGTMPNPITRTSTGSTASFTFPDPGFYAFYCGVHGSDDGSFMAGVIWVE